MTRNPCVSVVLPMRNGERYVGEAIASVLKDPWEPGEIVVVDDGSADRGAEIARRFGARVRVIAQPASGTGAAKNRAIDASLGSSLAFIDADDLWPPGRLTLQLQVLLDDPRLEAVFGTTIQFPSPDLPEEDRRRVYCPPDPAVAELVCAMLIRRTAFDRVGPFRSDLAVGVDMDWMLRAKEAGLRTRMIPDVVLRRRIHAANTGVVRRDMFHQRLHILKQALDRRRARPPGGDSL